MALNDVYKVITNENTRKCSLRSTDFFIDKRLYLGPLKTSKRDFEKIFAKFAGPRSRD